MRKNKTLYFLGSLLCLMLFIVVYVNANADKFASARGDFYFNRNDYANAIKNYELAFNMGSNDSKARDNYVNILINSPMTSEAQERLIKFLANNTEDGAKLKAEYFLYDIKKEIYKKYPNNYIRQAVYNGKIMRWGKLPITYGFYNTENVPDYYIKEIDKAFSEWEKATDHIILFEKSNNKPNIVISFIPEKPPGDEDKKYIVAYTVPYVSSDDKLKHIGINFYVRDMDGELFTENQVYNTALHEAVHAMGFMGHSSDKNNIMYISKDNKSVLDDLRETITAADVNTVKLLYNIKPDITNANETNSEYIPQVVLGDDREVANSKIREAKFYINKAPNVANGYVDLAAGYMSAKDYSKAIKTLEKALQLADTKGMQSMVYYNLAVAYYYIDNLEISEAYLDKSIEILNTEEKRFLLAEVYTRLGKTDLAIAEYEGLILKNPHNIEYAISLANIYVRNKQYLKARKVLKSYSKNNPQDRKSPRFAPYGIVSIGL